MPITITKKLYVLDDDHLRNLGISNIGDPGFDPSDRNRLYMHYNSKAGNIQLNPETNLYGRANLMGGNYTFDPSGDYLNAGWPGEGGSMPIRNTGSGLDRPNAEATGPGGATFGSNGLRIGLPRMSPNTGGFDASVNQCPLGFYLYNNVCVPGAMMDPGNANNILGINTGSGSYQKAKGVILRVIPPVKTQKGKLFQIVTQIQNIGHQPGKFFIKASVPAIGIAESMSNSIFVQGGQTGVVYATLQMPATVPANSLMMVKSDLYQTLVGSPDATPAHEDSNEAQLPNPDTVLGMPPVRPPIPQFPVSSVPNQTGSFGYPYNAPQAPPRYPPPPSFRGFAGFLDYTQDPYYQYQQQFQDPYMMQQQQQYPPMYGGVPGVNYMQDPNMMYYQQQQQQYPPMYQDPYAQQQMYQDQQYQSPYGAATPSPYPIYPSSPASAPYYQQQQQPQYYQPPMFDIPPQPQQQQQPLISINTQDLGSAQGGNIDFNTGTVVGGSLGGMSGGTISGLDLKGFGGGGNSGLGNSISSNVNDQIQNAFNKSGLTNDSSGGVDSTGSSGDIGSGSTGSGSTGSGGSTANEYATTKGTKHGKKSKKGKSKRHHTSRSHFASTDDDITLSSGQDINIAPSGFMPGEEVAVQLYSADYLMGVHRLKQLLGGTRATASDYGDITPIKVKVPEIVGKYLAIICMGRSSNKKIKSLFSIQ